MDKDPRFWHSRGYLPHFDKEGFTQFITFRLADSLPQDVLDRWHAELRGGEITDADHRRRIEVYLDQNYGAGHLRDHRIANVLQDTILKWDGKRYKLIAWVIMPNHGHILLTPESGVTVPEIVHSIKSYTAHAANEILKRTGQFWAREYFDRYIRDSKHFASTIAYIENNPVKARLCKLPEEWPYCSANLKL
ncbi:MAG TPA: transposase [Pyrinomonadaceae bacterium]|mgnify:CR=1 FL=1|nr:transposase [Chloracidobacterium sp.]MBP9935065.1 transposase [Pyrinomonadaceae bacterium]MBK7801309.1 transposase [Chloracidobacterium sp.]MBK9436631.1 transposase [Chloracidobacterium sp.]MBK9766248.1 transposase [Chloracidobacterium sp.]